MLYYFGTTKQYDTVTVHHKRHNTIYVYWNWRWRIL